MPHPPARGGRSVAREAAPQTRASLALDDTPEGAGDLTTTQHGSSGADDQRGDAGLLGSAQVADSLADVVDAGEGTVLETGAQ